MHESLKVRHACGLANNAFLAINDYNCGMKNSPVNINFTKMAIAFRSHVRLKAAQAGSSIVYMKNGQLIEENPKDATTKIRNSSLAGR